MVIGPGEFRGGQNDLATGVVAAEANTSPTTRCGGALAKLDNETAGGDQGCPYRGERLARYGLRRWQPWLGSEAQWRRDMVMRTTNGDDGEI